MPLERKDSVADTSTTTGLGTFTLTGIAPAGYRDFTAFTTGATVRYRIQQSDGSEWEVGEGVWTTSGATLTRVTVYASSNAGALVDFSAGTKIVSAVVVAADIPRGPQLLSVRRTIAANTTAAGYQKIPFDFVDIDGDNIWSAANTRATPTRAGWYQVTVQLRTSTLGLLYAAVGKNGAFDTFVGTPCANDQNAGGTGAIYCNGTTDYIEPWAYATTIRALSVTAGHCYFQVYGPL